jgi:hypothetical protein
LHEGKKRKRCQDVVQLIGAFNVEYADVGGVFADDSPKVAPRAVALRLLRALFLVRAQLIDTFGIRVVRYVNVHSHVEQHGQRSARAGAVLMLRRSASR